MKAGLFISVTLHAALLGFGLFSLSAPRAFEVSDVEALPVEIVPIESVTQIQEGDKQAALAETPAPQPTERPDTVEDATETGDKEVDFETPPTPETRPRPVEQAAEPPPSPEPEPRPEPEPEPEQRTETEEVPVPATEVRPEPEPRQEVTPDPAAETAVAESPEAERVALPDNAPVPQARPRPPQAQTAKAPERRDAEEPARQQETAVQQSDSSEKLLDDVAALLNKQEASGGGAARSEREAALGGSQNTPGEKLTQSEMDALRGQIQRCWNVPPGALEADDLRVSIRMRLDPSGAIEGSPSVIEGGGASGLQRAAADSARRAVLQCAPYNLPSEKYGAWADVIVNFDPSDMF